MLLFFIVVVNVVFVAFSVVVYVRYCCFLLLFVVIGASVVSVCGVLVVARRQSCWSCCLRGCFLVCCVLFVVAVIDVTAVMFHAVFACLVLLLWL